MFNNLFSCIILINKLICYLLIIVVYLDQIVYHKLDQSLVNSIVVSALFILLYKEHIDENGNS